MFHPFEFGAGVTTGLTTGGVRSMLMSLTVKEAEIPALFAHVPTTDWPLPSVVTVVGAGGLPAASPETASEHWNVTVTDDLFQSFTFGAGERDALMLGGV